MKDFFEWSNFLRIKKVRKKEKQLRELSEKISVLRNFVF